LRFGVFPPNVCWEGSCAEDGSVHGLARYMCIDWYGGGTEIRSDIGHKEGSVIRQNI